MTTASTGQPYPPLDLADRVLSLESKANPIAAYEEIGGQTKQSLLELLGPDWSFSGRRVLDFGCGAGRTLRHFLAEAEYGEFWGAELDAASVEWLSGHLSPPLKVIRSGAYPPLALEGDSFDCAWAISLFTHLTHNSIPWLVELHRVLKPGGLLMASYMGEYNSRSFDDEPWDEDRIGMNVLSHDNPWDRGGPFVLMSDWWVRAHWGRAFEILEAKPVHGQTWTLLRKKDVRITVADIQRPTDDPREIAALRYNLLQLQREVEAVRARYERSMSWKLTQPLRAAKRAARSRLARQP